MATRRCFRTMSPRSIAPPPVCPSSFTAASIVHTSREVYGTLDVLVVPSLWPENSPLVIHEAFMHGVTVVGIPQLAAFPISSSTE